MQQVSEGLVIVDLEGHFLFANEAAQKIVGIGPEESPPDEWSSVYGCFLPDKVTPYPSEQLPLARAMRGEHVQEEEIFIPTRRMEPGSTSTALRCATERAGSPAG